jgi:hypothetical protein
MNKLSKYFTILTMLVLLLAACGKPTPTAVPTASPTARPLIPDGSYTTSITKDEAINAGLGDLACENAGAMTLRFEGERFYFSQTPVPGCKLLAPTYKGSWKISGEIVSFLDDRSSGCSLSYKYNWAFDGTALRFTPVEDQCKMRKFYLSVHPWILQK